jgi:heme-degrading monooxygenase HmoA
MNTSDMNKSDMNKSEITRSEMNTSEITRSEMITVRLWHGRVPAGKAARYRAFLNARAIPDYQSTPGNLSVHILERAQGDVTHFVTLTFWESLESIRAFAGDDIEAAKYYPEDTDFLLEFEPRVVHYEVVGHGSRV